nr:hypothetical protein CFP56_05939 [Quercus suber]
MGSSSSSMDYNSPVQTPATSNHQRSSKLGNGKAIDTSEILSNTCPGVTPINDPLREATPIDSDVINGINSHSVGPDIEGECNGCTEDVNAKTATHGSVCNARSGINIHNLDPDCTHERNSGLNMEVNAVDLLPKSVSVEQTVESDKQSNEIDAELSKFDMQNSPAVNTLRPESRASKFSRPKSSWAY